MNTGTGKSREASASMMGKVARGAGKGSLAILDQGLISGSNFIISILLARWLMPDQYGAYAVAFGIWIMLSLVYQSLVLEPMGVFGGSTFRTNLRGYLRSLLSIHVALSVTICAALVICWAVAHRVGAGAATTGALAGIAFASPCLMLFNLARRSFLCRAFTCPGSGRSIYLFGSRSHGFVPGVPPRAAFAVDGVSAHWDRRPGDGNRPDDRSAAGSER